MKKIQLQVLTTFAFVITGLSVIVGGIGLVLSFNLGRLGTELPVRTVDQFRNIANIMPLVNELTTGLDALPKGNQELNRDRISFTINKISVAKGLILGDFNNNPPYGLKIIIEEISRILDDLVQVLDTEMPNAKAVILFKNRIDYIYAELRDYILRINNDTLAVLGRQKAEINTLNTVVFVSSLIGLGAAVLSLSMLRILRRFFNQIDQSRQIALDSSQAKSDFLSNMSHEIRTPMNAIIGLSYLALKTDLTGTQRDYLKRIQTSSQHLLGIINDVLDFSKIEAGKLSMERIAFELHKVLDNVSTLITEKVRSKGLDLIFHLDPAVPERLVGDPLRLGQILVNLANNAVKFTEHGEIVINVRVRAETSHEIELEFEVRDTGIGLKEEQIPLLFSSFQQADSSITRKFGGTGLGLAISRRLAELMGGKIGVSSQYGQGSTFWFTAMLGRDSGEQRVLVPDPDLRGRRVLVADDHEQSRAAIAEMLSSMSFKVVATASGPATLEEIRRAKEESQPYEIAFLDWQMPGMDGLETARRIRELTPVPPPHIVIITAYGREEIILLANSMGIEDVLIKPINPSMLFDVAMHLLRGAVRETTRTTPAPEAGASEPDTGLCGARILLVEDNEDNQQVAVEILRSAGCSIDIADNGQVAIQKVRTNPYDLVLMDIQMPILDGLQATREIRRLLGGGHLPIIAMTANTLKESQERCRAAGMDDYLSKPIDPDNLFAVLRRHFTGQVAVSAGAQPKTESLVSPPEITGIDTASGLRRVVGNLAVYRDLLRRFADGQTDAVRRIREALAGSDLPLAERVAHTLKGVAGNIGAERVQTTAEEAERAIGEGWSLDRLNDQLGRLEALVAETARQIVAALSKEPEPSPPAANTESLREALGRLIRLAEESDSETLDCLEAMRDQLRQNCAPALCTEIDSAIRSFDFSTALPLLRQVQQDWAGKD